MGQHLVLPGPPLCLHRVRGRTTPATTTTLHPPLLAPKWAKAPRVALVLQVLHLFLPPFPLPAPLLYCSVSQLACSSMANLPPTLLLLFLRVLVSPPPLLSYPGGLRTSQQYPPSESPHEVGEQRHWVHHSTAMASTWKWQQTNHSSDFEDYAHLLVKCPRKITLYVMMNPLFKGRNCICQKNIYILFDISISERQERKKKKEENYASWLSQWLTHLGCDSLSPVFLLVCLIAAWLSFLHKWV